MLVHKPYPRISIFIVLIMMIANPFVAQENLVPNNSFENIHYKPTGWFYKGEDITGLLENWYAPTKASPDYYSSSTDVPKDWSSKGFGEIRTLHGDAYVGMTLYGCKNGKPHCKEYLQVELREPLVVGQKYEVSVYYAHLEKSLFVDNIGIHFSLDKILKETDELIGVNPMFKTKRITKADHHQWKQLKMTIKAKEESRFLTLGCFSPDEKMDVSNERRAKYNYAYYYFDNVSVKKIPPIIESKKPELPAYRVGDLIQLDNIYFNLNRSDLLAESYEELNVLLKILRDNPSLVIEIHGHTDNLGDDQYNLDLSRNRSRAVMNYLIDNGIVADRLSFKGFGSARPIASNKTATGRSKNRRVEFLIVQY